VFPGLKFFAAGAVEVFIGDEPPSEVSCVTMVSLTLDETAEYFSWRMSEGFGWDGGGGDAVGRGVAS
jgi:hypothetical protein